MKEKIKELLLSIAIIAFGIVLIMFMDGWMWYIGGFIPVTNTVLGGLLILVGIFIFLSAILKKK